MHEPTRLRVIVIVLLWNFVGSQTTTLSIVYQNREIDGETYPGYAIVGDGPNWRDVGGINGVYIPEGEDFSFIYENKLDEQTILHVHGLLPPSDLDGVPYLSSLPIQPNRTSLVQYDLNGATNGSFLIHSHFGFQMGNGLLAPLIVEGDDPEYPLYHEIKNAQQVTMFLEDVCPYTSVKYNQKLEEALATGSAIPDTSFNREAGKKLLADCSSWDVFLQLAYVFETTYEGPATCPVTPATASDIQFTKYIANGKSYLSPFIKGNMDFNKPIRVRVINGATTTNFQVVFPFEVVLFATDAQYINPYSNTTFWVSPGQRLDFLVNVPAHDNSLHYFPVTAWSETVTGSVPAPIFISKSANAQIDYDPPTYITGMMDNYLDFVTEPFIRLPIKPVDRKIAINLTGDNGFKGINGTGYRLQPLVDTFSPNPNPILVSYGQRAEIVIQNQNIDGHPMHLHGHVFQIVDIDGRRVNGPMRDVAFVPGGCRNVTIAFDAVNPGTWAFHCHLEFHLASGMLTTVEYN